MQDWLKNVQENGPYIMNISMMFIGVFASFLSSSVKKKMQIGGLIIFALVFNILTWFVYGRKEILCWTILLTLVWIGICILLIWRKEIVSRNRIDKMIRRFTDTADQYKPICIFGGDLDFFGNVVVNVKKCDKVFRRNKIIELNRQYKQLKNKGFRQIQILSVKPDSNNDEDQKTRIRIGFLKEKLKSALQIKFFEEKECSTCPEREVCLACDVCQTCLEEEKCKRIGRQLCDKVSKKFQSRCYNPDTQLRGRIAKRKSDGSTSAAIVTTHKSGKLYILKEYSSDTKECTIYQNIWDVWWRKCKMDDDFIKQCVDEYIKFKNGRGECGEKTNSE